MKIEKYIAKNWFYHFYLDGDFNIHGLFNNYSVRFIGYRYHNNRKGFHLKKIK